MKIPNREGFFWAKLVTPTRMPIGEDWRSLNWEVVEVIFNGGDADDEEFGVLVPGVSPMQWQKDFIWGPQIFLPKELENLK
jgi:hypothetical protein